MDLNIVEKKIDLLKKILKNIDYDLKESIVDISPVAGKSLVYNFSNQNKLIDLSVSFYIDKNIIVFLLINLKTKKSVFLDQLCEKEKIQFKDFFIKKEGVLDEQFLDNFLTEFEISINNSLKDYFLGIKWEDLPFDWAGFK